MHHVKKMSTDLIHLIFVNNDGICYWEGIFVIQGRNIYKFCKTDICYK